jgi:hypothetical protein
MSPLSPTTTPPPIRPAGHDADSADRPRRSRGHGRGRDQQLLLWPPSPSAAHALAGGRSIANRRIRSIRKLPWGKSGDGRREVVGQLPNPSTEKLKEKAEVPPDDRVLDPPDAAIDACPCGAHVISSMEARPGSWPVFRAPAYLRMLMAGSPRRRDQPRRRRARGAPSRRASLSTSSVHA